jgi:hypothetical protein
MLQDLSLAASPQHFRPGEMQLKHLVQVGIEGCDGHAVRSSPAWEGKLLCRGVMTQFC